MIHLKYITANSVAPSAPSALSAVSTISIILMFIFMFINSHHANAEQGNIKQKKKTSSKQISKQKKQSSEQKKQSSEQEKKSSEQEKKLRITSDSMLVEKISSIIQFSGNVVVTQQNTVISADSITVILFTDEEKSAQKSDIKQDIKEMIASGNVKFSSDNRSAFADQAIYTASDQKLVLTGDAPRIVTGGSYVTGKKIILYQNSGKVIVEGDKIKRVEALFNAKDNFKLENTF